MTYTSTKQYIAISLTTLISNFGGTLGLCLGMSLLSLVEIIELCMTWFIVLIKILKNRNSTVTDSSR